MFILSQKLLDDFGQSDVQNESDRLLERGVIRSSVRYKAQPQINPTSSVTKVSPLYTQDLIL